MNLQFISLKGESAICEELVNLLEAGKTYGQLKCVYFHVPNELPRSTNTVTFAQKLKRMGKRSGAPDYVFMWGAQGGFMEVKAHKGRLSEAQKQFAAECTMNGVRYEIVRSCDEAIEVLRNWGAWE